MNLNHIAKKPFFDLFYKTPCMAQLLRLAFNDAATFDPASRSGGTTGSIRYPQSLLRAENEGLKFAMSQVKSFRKYGNHITSDLTYADLI